MANFPLAVGHPDLSANKAIPELYAAKALVEFYDTSFIPQITNSDYEGEIKKHGDTVNIRTLPDVQINDYSMGENIAYPAANPSYVQLKIDKGKYWAFSQDEVAIAQQDISWIDELVPHATETARVQVEEDFLADIYSSAHASNKGLTAGKKSASYNIGVTGTPLQWTASNAIDIITRCGGVLDEQAAPGTGRYLIITPWMAQLLKNSELRSADIMGDASSVLRTNMIGRIGGFDIYQSNLIESVTDGSDTAWNCIFGQKVGVCFATQYINTRLKFELEKTFGVASRGLQVYGYKAVKSEALGHLYVKA